MTQIQISSETAIGALAALIALVGIVGAGAVAPAAAAPADNITVSSSDAVATDATPSWIAGDQGDVTVDLGDSSLSASNVTLQSADLTVSNELNNDQIVGTQINASDIGSGDVGDTATIDILVDGDAHETVTVEVIDPSVTTAEVPVSEINASNVTVTVDTDELAASDYYATAGRNSSEVGIEIVLAHDGQIINADRISTTDDQGIANLSASVHLTDPASLPPDGNVTISTANAVTEITVGGETVHQDQAAPITGVTGETSPLSTLTDTQLLAVAAAVAIGVLAVAGRAD